MSDDDGGIPDFLLRSTVDRSAALARYLAKHPLVDRPAIVIPADTPKPKLPIMGIPGANADDDDKS